MIVTPIIYLVLAVLFWRLFRRPHHAITRIGVTLTVAVCVLAIYRVAIFRYIENRQWVSEHVQVLTPVRLSTDDTLAFTDHRSCAGLCLDLLAKASVKSVVTNSQTLSFHSRDMLKTSLPYVEWTLTSDASYCGTVEAQTLMDSITGLSGYKTLLVQGYCLKIEPTATLERVYEVRIEQHQKYGGDDEVERGIWRVIRHDNGLQENLAELPFFRFRRPTIPPFYEMGGFYVTAGFHWTTVSEGPITVSEMLRLISGISAVDSLPQSAGPIWVDDPAPLVHAAARSASIPLQRSALAIICRAKIDNRQRFRDDVEILTESPDRQVKDDAGYCRRWVQ